MKYIFDTNRFYVEDEGKEIGEITFTRPDESTIVVDHTFVDPTYRGQNIAAHLVRHIYDYAVENKLFVIPVCPYVVKQFEVIEEYQSVLKK